jgi:hypothetical protein
MRSIRLAVLAAALLALAIGPPTASAAPSPSTPSPIHLVKDCAAFDGNVPSTCVVSTTDNFWLPLGTRVIYTGPLLDNPYFLMSNVTLDAGSGSTATGYCMFDGRPEALSGLCSFWNGTGDLTAFTAMLTVSIDELGLWHLDGVYYFDPNRLPPPEPGRHPRPRPS